MTYGPANALPLTMSASGVSASAEKTCSSTIGPAGLDRIWGKTWSLADLRWKTTVVGSGASTLSRLYSSELGPLPSSAPEAPIAIIRSKLNFTSEDVRSSPLANFSPGLSLTV